MQALGGGMPRGGGGAYEAGDAEGLHTPVQIPK